MFFSNKVSKDTDLEYLEIIRDYLKDYKYISREMITESDNNDRCFKKFKIFGNKLYACFDTNEREIWETRRESMIFLLLETLKKFTVPDIEFVMVYDWDSVNESNSYKMYDKNKKKLPIIVSTSVLESMNFILMPDFTFQFCPEYNFKNNFKMCEEVVKNSKDFSFKEKHTKLLWRGSANNNYRSKYSILTKKNPKIFDIKSVQGFIKKLGEESDTFKKKDSVTRNDKLFYKYLLYLNGHNGDCRNGAYSSSFKCV